MDGPYHKQPNEAIHHDISAQRVHNRLWNYVISRAIEITWEVTHILHNNPRDSRRNPVILHRSDPSMRTTLLERPFALAWGVLCPIIAATLGPDLYAEIFGSPELPPPPPEVSRTEHVLFIGNLNADFYPDTVVGNTSGGIPARSLPATIHWGQPRWVITHDSATGQPDTVIADSSRLGTIQLDRKVAVTIIHYPD
jgi:hypothetical protein